MGANEQLYDVVSWAVKHFSEFRETSLMNLLRQSEFEPGSNFRCG